MTLKLPIYMDHHATTPVDERVLEAMLPYFSSKFGNPASRHHVFGTEAKAVVDRAREQVALLLGARPGEVIFTSGATEADNLAILGTARANASKGRHIVTSPTEHSAVLDCCRALVKEGFEITYLSVDRFGGIDLEELRSAIRPDTILVTLMAANNEIGTLHPLDAIGAITRECGVLFHTDATQAAGKIPIDVEAAQVDMVSLSGHKMYGPKGIGALWVRQRRPRVRLVPILHGGGHEHGLRSGTLNVPGIVGLAKACEVARSEMPAEARRLTDLTSRLHQGLARELDRVYLNGDPERRVPGNLNVSFEFVDGGELLNGLDDIAVASRSACTTASDEPSHVLRAIGVPERLAQASIRFGLGRGNTLEEVDYVVGKVTALVRRLRELSPLSRQVSRDGGRSAGDHTAGHHSGGDPSGGGQRRADS
ncbi:MAG: aminotransferase class V-fold PLP-dependent enzyme [Planctomycetota bacterium]